MRDLMFYYIPYFALTLVLLGAISVTIENLCFKRDHEEAEERREDRQDALADDDEGKAHLLI